MSAILHQIIYKFISIIMSVTMLFGGTGDYLKADSSEWNTNYKYIFVHGLSGWGSYDSIYKLMPYWGMFGGDLMEYLRDKGFDCYAASVAPSDSAWDRACELYAQLAGTVVDYGKAHSEKCGHERYGTDFTGRALIDSWSAEDKINLLGHSFGGATVRLFAHIMENGSQEEVKATPEAELSEFFKGGKGDYIYSVVALAAPHNGTTAYNVGTEDVPENENETAFDSVKTKIQNALSDLVGKANGEKEESKAAWDYASYDMYIDNAMAMNEWLETLPDAYYFSIPCDATVKNEDGTYSPVEKKMEPLFVSSSKAMGAYTGKTEGGYTIDESWRQNDGLVNTLSAKAPSGAPSKDFEEGNVTKGVWNIMPTYDGDHMSLQGGLTKINDVKDLYVDLLSMINKL
ncbi:MAG: hypothetical protein UHM85_00620 [Acutalibacteraceae bacterium]|nr:hypothetical protein [Acutalibacteraceae bacterium]